MQTFDQHLMDLVAEGTVTYQTALAAATNPSDFELQMRTLKRLTQSQMLAMDQEPAQETPEPNAPADRPAGFTDDLSDMLPSP
jgi:hypothetical protein